MSYNQSDVEEIIQKAVDAGWKPEPFPVILKDQASITKILNEIKNFWIEKDSSHP